MSSFNSLYQELAKLLEKGLRIKINVAHKKTRYHMVTSSIIF